MLVYAYIASENDTARVFLFRDVKELLVLVRQQKTCTVYRVAFEFALRIR